MAYKDIPSCGTASPMEANTGEKIQSGEPGECPEKGTSYIQKTNMDWTEGVSLDTGIKTTSLGTSKSTIDDIRGGQGNA